MAQAELVKKVCNHKESSGGIQRPMLVELCRFVCVGKYTIYARSSWWTDIFVLNLFLMRVGGAILVQGSWAEWYNLQIWLKKEKMDHWSDGILNVKSRGATEGF